MTLHKLGPSGWEYLVDSVSVADEGRGLGADLVAYYAATDNPPGLWTGALAQVLGVSGSEADREQIRNLFGLGRHPVFLREYARALALAVGPDVDADALARALRRNPSVVKRVLSGAEQAHRVNERMAAEGADVTGGARTTLRNRIRAEENAADARSVARAAQRLSRGDADDKVLADVLTRATPADLVAAGEGLRLGRTFPVHRSVAERARTRFQAHAATHPQATETELAQARVAIEREEDARGERQAVTGFDLVFSPPKSISTAWALAVISGDDATRLALEEAHNEAVRSVVERLENDVAFTRVGAGGAAQVKAEGVAAVAFLHRTSRAGDPDLHTHVIVSGKTRGPDGQWRSLDARALYAAKVTLSEQYNSTVLDGVTRRLGWESGVRADQVGHASRAIREIVGIPEVLNKAFSSRRAQVKAEYAERYRDFRRVHGREPGRGEEYELLQQATLANRPGKDKGSTATAEAERWREIARDILGPGYATFLAGLSRTGTAVRAEQVSPALIARWARATVEGTQKHRSTWTVRNLEAEAHRVTRDTAFTTPGDRVAVVGSILAAATWDGHVVDDGTGNRVVRITPRSLIEEPASLRRADGVAVFEQHAATRFTSSAILDAEHRLLAHARAHGAPILSPAAVEAAIADAERRDGYALAPDQQAAVRHLAGNGTWLTSLIGPAGTGKTTTMRTLVQAAERDGWQVVGLAPSARAAQVLADTAGIRVVENTDRWAGMLREGHVVPHPRTLVLIDEAGMAGTLTLDAITRAHVAAGAIVRLVGDPQQLAAVESGGVLRYLHHHADTAELASVWRFRDPDGSPRTWEIDASLRLRDGDVTVVEEYLGHGRVHHGSIETMTDRVYADWLADTKAGRVSLMIASTNALATELSVRARADRVRAGTVEPGGAALHNGTRAGVGDLVVTRHNDRAMRLFAGRDWVKNGDVWTVTARSDNGSLRLRHTGHGGTVLLPPAYVGSHVELAYACTTHRSQGMTVDLSRSMVTADLSRENLYVMATRGSAANHLYVVVDEGLDPEGHTPADPIRTARQSLTAIIARSSAEHAAHDDVEAAIHARSSLATLAPRYRHAHGLVSFRLDDEAQERAADTVREVLPTALAEQVLGDEAWPALAHYIALADTDRHADHESRETLARALTRDFAVTAGEAARELGSVDSPAQLLAWRMEQRLFADDKPPRSGTMPWLPIPPRPVPGQDGEIARVTTYALSTFDRIEARAAHLAVAAAATGEPWTLSLGALPQDAAQRGQWLRTAAAVAAYRETFDVRCPTALDAPAEGEPVLKALARDRARETLEAHHGRPAVVDVPRGPGYDPDTLDRAALSRAVQRAEKMYAARTRRAEHLHGRAARLLADADADAGRGPASRGLRAHTAEITERVHAIEDVALLAAALRAAHERHGATVAGGGIDSSSTGATRTARARIERLNAAILQARHPAGPEHEWAAVLNTHAHLTRSGDLQREAAIAVDRATGLAVREDAERYTRRAGESRDERDALQARLREHPTTTSKLGDVARALDAAHPTTSRPNPTRVPAPPEQLTLPETGPELA